MKYHQTYYTPKNADKYIGSHLPYCRSSWEVRLCIACDNHPNIIGWASEPCKIPYLNPLTQKMSVYIPDFLIVYMDKNGQKHSEIIEVKPSTQILENAKRKNDKLAAVVNASKWHAAQVYCERMGMKFRVMTEENIFAGKKK